MSCNGTDRVFHWGGQDVRSTRDNCYKFYYRYSIANAECIAKFLVIEPCRQFGRPARSAFVYTAVAFDKLGKLFGIRFKLVGISKHSRPFASSLCVHLTWIRRADNNNGKRLDLSNPPNRPKRLMRTRLGTMLFSPPANDFKYRSQVIINCIPSPGRLIPFPGDLRLRQVVLDARTVYLGACLGPQAKKPDRWCRNRLRRHLRKWLFEKH